MAYYKGMRSNNDFKDTLDQRGVEYGDEAKADDLVELLENSEDKEPLTLAENYSEDNDGDDNPDDGDESKDDSQDNSDDGKKDDTENDDEPNADSGYYYWLHVKSYTSEQRPGGNDDEYRLLKAGLYHFDSEDEKLSSAPDKLVSTYEGRPEDHEIVKIAEDRGMSFEAGKKIDYDGLLAELVDEPRYLFE